MTSASIYGLLGSGLLFGSIGVGVAPPDRRRLAFAAAVVPGLLAGSYVRGLLSDFSVTTLVVLAAFVLERLGGPRIASMRELDAVFGVVLAAALALYPWALGLSPYDPYEAGFAPLTLLVVVGLVAFGAGFLRLRLLWTCLLAAVAAHALGLSDSQNLWDYLLDPWIGLCAAYWWVHGRRRG